MKISVKRKTVVAYCFNYDTLCGLFRNNLRILQFHITLSSKFLPKLVSLKSQRKKFDFIQYQSPAFSKYLRFLKKKTTGLVDTHETTAVNVFDRN